MQANATESRETPAQRVADLTDHECRVALTRIVSSILAAKNTREVPDILHRARLLSQFDVYDSDAAWTDLEDLVRAAARYAVA